MYEGQRDEPASLTEAVQIEQRPEDVRSLRRAVLISAVLAGVPRRFVKTRLQPAAPPAAAAADEDDRLGVSHARATTPRTSRGSVRAAAWTLVHAAPFDVRDYQLDFHTVPAVVKPGQKATLRFRIRHPGTGEVIRKFEVVHERQYHLFVISQDMEYFQHIHPAGAARRHLDDRGDAAQGRLLQGAVGLSAGRRLVAVSRPAARHRRI